MTRPRKDTTWQCPRCKRGRLRKHVSIFADCPADCRNLSKKGIRSRDVVIMGVDWPQERVYCPECGWRMKA